MNKKIILIGYSGHAFVIADIFEKAGRKLLGYCDNEEKSLNPFNLIYFGKETEEIGLKNLKANDFFIAIGDNKIRHKVYKNLKSAGLYPTIALHPSAVISSKISMGNGVMVAGNVTINPLAKIGNGVICNSGSIIEHECEIGDFTHIAPGATLAGNVKIGEESFVGANSVIKQGVDIGKNVVIGAGTVIIKNVPDNVTVVGNPQRILVITTMKNK